LKGTRKGGLRIAKNRDARGAKYRQGFKPKVGRERKENKDNGTTYTQGDGGWFGEL